ncbi:arsenate reductase [Nitrosomonas ureae]|uniref:Arsenate reductase n=1 Tax=Nitrosomonas ureae TaxID=44577 RepID=A0A1H2F8R2_9PROT|nr:arsenate reductase [Nitrosomonas ureae]
MNLLFLCTGNSCRSILAEATFNALAPKGWQGMSAGSQPTGQVHPRSLALLDREGISTEGLYSKSWSNLPVKPDIVITVCGNAAGETCPTYLRPALRAHWGVSMIRPKLPEPRKKSIRHLRRLILPYVKVSRLS